MVLSTLAHSRPSGFRTPERGNHMKTQNIERLHALDAVRGGALLLGIVVHLSMSFWPIPLWPIRDNDPSSALLTSFGVIHIFRMSLFFVIAGFFARLLLEKRGPRGFVADRAKRIAIPLLVSWPLLFAAFIAVIIWSAIRAGTWEAMQAQPQPALSWGTIPLLHTWFLYVLLWLYAAALAVVGLVRLVDRKGRIAGAADGFVRAIVKTQLAPIVLGLPLFAVFAFEQSWIPWGGIRTPDVGLVPNLSACVAFATAFGFGWLLHRQIDLLSVWRRWWPLHLAAAAGLSVVCSSYSELAANPTAIAEMGLTDRLWSSAAYPLAIWTWSLGLIGLAIGLLDQREQDDSLSRRLELLGLSDPSAGGDGVSGAVRQHCLALVREVPAHARRCDGAHASELSATRAEHLHRLGAERQAHPGQEPRASRRIAERAFR